MVKRKCDNCGKTDEDRLFFYLRDPRNQERIGFCSLGCYIQGMKDRGVYAQIKREAIKKYDKEVKRYVAQAPK